MPKHLDLYQAKQYVDSMMRAAANTSKEYDLPFFAVGNSNNIKTNMDLPQLQELKQSIDHLMDKKQTVNCATQALENVIERKKATSKNS